MTFPSEKIRELRTRDEKKHDWLLEHGAKLLKMGNGVLTLAASTPRARGGELEAYDAMARKYERWKVESGGETWEFPDRKIKEEQDVDKRRYKIWSGYPGARLINLRKSFVVPLLFPVFPGLQAVIKLEKNNLRLVST